MTQILKSVKSAQSADKFMNFITPPSRPTFWRVILIVTAALPLLSIWNLINLAARLGVDIFTRASWQAGIAALVMLASMALLGLGISFTKTGDQLWSRVEALGFIPKIFGIALIVIASTGFPLVVTNSFFQNILGGEAWVRMLVFWMFSLAGMWGVKIFRKEISWSLALIVFMLCQSVLQTLLINIPLVTAYPFAMGWSETSRYYYPSLFLSRDIYGEQFALPILHPTLHALLAPPYLFDAPLWFHRFWQTFLRLALAGLIVPALMARLSIQNRGVKIFTGMWMILFLLMGPIYLHLIIPVLILLYGFSPHRPTRSWVAVLLASLWAGTSRVNWYVMPGMIVAVLYLLEVPLTCNGRSLTSARGIRMNHVLRYLLKPALWFVVGTATAYASMQIYIAFSGIPNPEDFFTSLSSPLLWYRLLPNESYAFGILPAAIFVSLPMWIVLYQQFRSRRADWHPVRIFFILAALLALFLGGLVVSLKIGGGADLHNLDAYFTMLLIVFSYLVFARYTPEKRTAEFIPLPWGNVMSIIVIPILFLTQTNISFKTYDKSRTDAVLQTLQEKVDQVNANGGEILFITQRHLISMGMLHNVTLVPEYEREELMEMAMSNNEEFLAHFKQEMESQRFDLIVVDPLTFKILARRRAFSEENNVWVRGIMRPILCNYRLEESFLEDEVALYVPQEGERVCP
jgi:flagellar biosynthesis protein FliQ